MSKLAALYNESVNNPTAGLYDAVVSPFKKGPDFLPSALAELNRDVTTSSAPAKLLDDPIKTMLDRVRTTERDATFVDTPNVVEPKFANVPKFPTLGLDKSKFMTDTAQTESGGDYKAKNKTSSASGRYQFLWGTWGESIQKVTGVKNEKQFRDTPGAQDKFFNFYTDKVIKPAVDRLADLAERHKLSQNDLARIIHFRGEKGAERALKLNQLNKKLENNNMTINQYLGRK